MLGLIVSKNDPFTDQKTYGLSLIRKKWVRAKNAIQLCLYLPKRLVSELELDILIVAPRFSHRQGRGYEEDFADFVPFSFSAHRSSLHQTVIKFPPIFDLSRFLSALRTARAARALATRALLVGRLQPMLLAARWTTCGRISRCFQCHVSRISRLSRL